MVFVSVQKMALRLLGNLSARQTLRVRFNIGFFGAEGTLFCQSLSTLNRSSKQICSAVWSKTDQQIHNGQCHSYRSGLLSSLVVYSKFTTSSKFYQNDDYYKNEDGYLIYVGESGSSIKLALASMYSISGVVIAATPTLLQKVAEYTFMPHMIMVMTFFLGVLNPTLFYLFCQRYVQELYHNKEADLYTALVPSPLILGHKRIAFKPRDCSMPAKMTLFSSFLVRGKPLFINSDMMDYGAYSRMLRKAKEFDYENPDRQSEYEASVESSLKRLKKEKTKDE